MSLDRMGPRTVITCGSCIVSPLQAAASAAAAAGIAFTNHRLFIISRLCPFLSHSITLDRPRSRPDTVKPLPIPANSYPTTPVKLLMEKNRRRMVALLSELTSSEGLHATIMDGVQVRRSDRNVPRTPVLYEPSIYIVASGRKKGYVGNRQLEYDPNHYLVLSVPLPFECEAEIGNGEPLLALSVRMDIAIISELATRMDVRLRHDSPHALACVHATPLDPALSDAAVRLLECLRFPVDAEILGPSIMREITYRVLCGPRRETLLAMLGRNGQAARIHAVLRRMHARYSEPLDISRVATEAGMSISALHHQFKAVTSTSPVQYLKAVRLHKARLLMLQDGIGAAVAADRVGYQSTSQFSREFKRLFGHSPLEESRHMRARPGLNSTANEPPLERRQRLFSLVNQHYD
jgi:AraC-like DNA-binding protein